MKPFVCKQMSSDLFKMLPTNYLFTVFNIHMYKEDLALNNLQGLICHKAQLTNQIYCDQYIYFYLLYIHILKPSQKCIHNQINNVPNAIHVLDIFISSILQFININI